MADAGQGDHEHDDENTPGYKPPAVKTLEQIIKTDTEDESLKKYKETLLGTDVVGLVVCESLCFDDLGPQ